MNKLREFYQDKQMRLEVFNHITECAKQVLIERATKEQPTDWFRPLLETLADSDSALGQMFEVQQDKPKLNRAK